MVKHKKNSHESEKTIESESKEYEFERKRLEKWRPGNRNFP